MIRQAKRQVEEVVYEEDLECNRCGVHAPKLAPERAGKGDPLADYSYDVPRGAWFAAADKKGWGYAYSATAGRENHARQMYPFCPACFTAVDAFLQTKAVPPKPAPREAPRPMPNPYSRFEVE